MSSCWNVTLLRPSRGLRPLWVHERRSLAVKRRPFSLLAVANLPGASRGQKFIPQAVGGHHVANSAAVVAAPAPPLPQQLSYGGGSGQAQQTVKPGELRHVMVNVNYVDDVNYLEHLFQRAPASGSGVVPLAEPAPQQQPQAEPSSVQQPGVEFEDISSLLGQDLGSMLGELQQFSTELAGLSNEFFSSDVAQSAAVLEQATAKVQKERQRKQARAVKAAASRKPKASSSSKAGSSRTGSSARKRVKGTLTTSTRTTRAGAAAAAAAAAAAGEDGAVPNVLIRSTNNGAKGSRRSSAAASRGSRSVAAAAAATAAPAGPAAAPQPQEQQQQAAAQAVQASQEQQQAGGAAEQAAAAAAADVTSSSSSSSSSSSRSGAALRGSASSGVVPFPVGARARAAARNSSQLSWGRVPRAAAPAAAPRLKKADLAREAQTNPALIMRSITQRTLLSGEQERQLAAFVQPLVELEKTAAEFKLLHRRAPTDAELAAVAGKELPEMEQIRTLGTQAREHMVNCNVRLVTSIAKKYLGRGMELQDMVAEGVMGLRRGVEKFDPSKGFKFSTYAHWWIRQAITRSISDQGRVVRLPVHLHEAMSKVKRVEELLMQELGRHPSEEEVAARSGMSWAKLNYLHKCFRNPVTGDMPAMLGGDDREEGDQRGHEAMEEDEEQDPARVAGAILLQDDLNNVLLTLTDREAGILRMRFGLDDGVEKTLEEVGRAFNVTRERIRQIESKAIRKLRSPSRMMQLCSV